MVNLRKNKNNSDHGGTSLNVEDKFKHLFELSPLAIVVFDYSELKIHLEIIRKKEISNLESYLHENPKELEELISRVSIVNVNNSAIRLFKAKSKKHFIEDINKLFTNESINAFIREIATYYDGVLRFVTENTILDFQGNLVQAMVTLEISPNDSRWEFVTASLTDLS